MFAKLDLNRDNKITIEELLMSLKEDGAPIPESVVRTVFVISDSDCDDSLNIYELNRFLRLMAAI